jgi:3-dehydroquinate synthase
VSAAFELVITGREESLIWAGDLAELPEHGALRRTRILPVLDVNALNAHRVRIEALQLRLGATVLEPLLLPGGESCKAMSGFPSLVESALARGLDRNTRLLVVGGGAVLDAGQFLAAVLLRGLECLVVPTTLLAQVDAGLGGKCGLDVGASKNQVGVIRQPRAVLVDPAFLSTLPSSELQSGWGEMCKMALLEGEECINTLKSCAQEGSRIPDACVLRALLRAKARFVASDAREQGRRVFLNLGHTVGHALESLALESEVALPHGVAIALGLRAETRWFNAEAAPLVDGLLDACGLPTAAPAGLDWSRLEDHLVRDKKVREGLLRVPVIGSAGQAWIVMAAVADCAAAARSLAS